VAAGHVRRYDITTLRSAASQAGLRVTKWTYWGLPLMPALVARKALLALQRNKENIISSGFDSRSNLVNSLMATLAACEFIPQHLAGTSLMAILERA